MKNPEKAIRKIPSRTAKPSYCRPHVLNVTPDVVSNYTNASKV
jgi:hypothetical protein